MLDFGLFGSIYAYFGAFWDYSENLEAYLRAFLGQSKGVGGPIQGGSLSWDVLGLSRRLGAYLKALKAILGLFYTYFGAFFGLFLGSGGLS